MFPKIGEYCTLDVVKEVNFGFYLDGGPMGEILLPTNEVMDEIEVNVDTEQEVFIYNDNENRVIATTRKPLAIADTFGYMQCKDVNEYGAFLDWGLMKQLFVPFREQQKRMEVGRHYVVFVFVDEDTERMVASARINRFVGRKEIKTLKNEEVDILVTKKTDLGYKVIVNNAIWGLIFRSDAYRPLRIGQKSTGFVKTIREDGKVDVILRKAGLDGLNDAAQIILAKLEKSDNKTLYLTDNSDPEAIRLTLNMSKKMFKKGVGMLYKGGIIELEMDRIFLKE
ncbi:MAG: putative RNA-binding protein (virulence factor B family) [Saprospiraceae bacterium]|jgi:predicted RNA-binding protein (virulence factor B family)